MNYERFFVNSKAIHADGEIYWAINTPSCIRLYHLKWRRLSASPALYQRTITGTEFLFSDENTDQIR